MGRVEEVGQLLRRRRRRARQLREVDPREDRVERAPRNGDLQQAIPEVTQGHKDQAVALLAVAFQVVVFPEAADHPEEEQCQVLE